MKENFTSTFYLESMVESSDARQIMKLGDYTKNSMILTLIIPFAFMVFMSVSMDSVWSMYLMMQLVSNFTELILNLPGNVGYLMFIG